ncbi:MAG: hypothetical protein HY393_01415 [Candidatus Diapherotrites archaeon]|nr:hypothetical protein [Candidatus Diapherotrites archaeon]
MKTVTVSKHEAIKKGLLEKDELFIELMKGLEDIRLGRVSEWKPKPR